MKRPIALFAMLALAPPAAAEMDDDGLHKVPWMRDTFKDLAEDLDEANAEGKRLMIMVEQRGCIYCTRMHEEVFVVPETARYISDNFFVVQVNMFGDAEAAGFDGVTLPEKGMVKRRGALFTPGIYFLPEEVGAAQTASSAAVASMPGAFGRRTTFNMLNWVVEKGHGGDEPFQKYHARKLEAQEGLAPGAPAAGNRNSSS